MGEEGLDPSTSSGQRFFGAHVLWVAFAVVEDVAFDPVFVGLFGAVGVVFESDGVTHLVEEFAGWFLFHER